jgi:hypothetical protein
MGSAPRIKRSWRRSRRPLSRSGMSQTPVRGLRAESPRVRLPSRSRKLSPQLEDREDRNGWRCWARSSGLMPRSVCQQVAGMMSGSTSLAQSLARPVWTAMSSCSRQSGMMSRRSWKETSEEVSFAKKDRVSRWSSPACRRQIESRIVSMDSPRSTAIAVSSNKWGLE